MSNSEATTIAESYNDYYSIGLYRYRYPQANLRVLNTISQCIFPHRNEPVVLDYGCGNGRYIAPLLHLTNANIYGFDISQVALKQAEHHLHLPSKRVRLFHQRNELEKHINDNASPDVGLLLFGVLAHIKGEQERVKLLEWFHQHLNKDGRLVISVPNRWRRFLRQQWYQKHTRRIPGDIEYARFQSGQKIPLYYHLYTSKELIDELQRAGFELEILTAESIFPERAVLQSKVLASVDNFLCRILPASWGYGLLAVVRRAS